MRYKPGIESFFSRVFLILGLANVSARSASTEENADSTTRLQKEFLDWKFGMFIHYNIATYHDRQPACIQPSPLHSGSDSPRPWKVNGMSFACTHWHIMGIGGAESAAP